MSTDMLKSYIACVALRSVSTSKRKIIEEVADDKKKKVKKEINYLGCLHVPHYIFLMFK